MHLAIHHTEVETPNAPIRARISRLAAEFSGQLRGEQKSQFGVIQRDSSEPSPLVVHPSPEEQFLRLETSARGGTQMIAR